jgi:hypothetical protein
MTLHELFADHPCIVWSLIAFVVVEIVAAAVIVVRLFRKPKPRRGDSQ